MKIDASQDIRDRTFQFACDISRMALKLSPQPGIRRLIDQLVGAGTAVGANLEEAKASSSKREFLRLVEISLRESREAVYWLRICSALELGPPETLARLTDEGRQISRILGAIAVNTRRRLVVGYVAFFFCILHLAF